MVGDTIRRGHCELRRTDTRQTPPGDTLYGGSMFLDGKKAEICSETGLPPYIDYIPSPPAGEEDNWLIGRQALHAYSLTFNHPVTGRYLHLEAPVR